MPNKYYFNQYHSKIKRSNKQSQSSKKQKSFNSIPLYYYSFVQNYRQAITYSHIQFKQKVQKMNDDFIFPVNFEDLEQASYNRYNVEMVNIPNSQRDMWNTLDRITDGFVKNDQQIGGQYFNYFYHLIKIFNENIQGKPMGVLEKAGSSLREICKHILKIIDTNLDTLSEDELQKVRVMYKMVMFLVLFYINAVGRCKTKATQADIIAENIGKDKKKKKINDIELSYNVIQNVKKLIALLKQTLTIDYVKLWQRKQVDPELFKKYTDVCVRILESNLAKDQQVISDIFNILEVIIRAREQLFKDLFKVFTNLICESQANMTDVLVNFFSKAQSPQLQRLCTEALVNVVLYIIHKHFTPESSQIKNTKQFLSRLSQKIPKVFYNNLATFIRLYLHESYQLRIAISDILKNILKFVLNNQSDESLNRAREKFINTLIQRIYDKNSYCRAHTLQILNELTSEKIVPKKYTIMFLKAGVDRIKDQSVHTRKKALQLISTIMQDVWPEDQTLRSLSALQDELQMIKMSKDRAEKQLQQIKAKIDGEDFEDEIQLQKMTRQGNLLHKKFVQYQKKQLEVQQEQQVVSLIQDVLQKVKILLSSKTETDVLETIKLFIKFYTRKIQLCKQFLPNIRLLIFSKDKKIKDQVLMTFTSLHIIDKRNQQVANQLISLFEEASPQDHSALEQILQIIVSQSLAKGIPIIKMGVYMILWHKFVHYERGNTSDQKSQLETIIEKRAILTILRITFNKDPTMVKQENVSAFVNILKKYISTKNPDFYILRQILKVMMIQPKTCPIIDNNARNLLLAVICILVNSQQTPDQDWYSVSEHLLTCIYKISQNPQKLTEVLLKKLHENLVDKKPSSISVAHFIFTLSHGCLKMLIHLDSLQNKIKSINNDDGKGKNRNQNDDQQELDKVVGGVEAEIDKKVAQIQELGEKIIQDPFINRWVKVVESIVQDLSTGNQLQIIAVLSYCKFMCISKSYCEENIKKLMQLLRKQNVDSVIKNNIIIAIGDLLHRFPNTVQKQGQQLYPRLHDKDIRVRKTTLTVLTHLALNDMIKIKGHNICYIAKLFQDDDPEIESLVKQFFSEVNRKDPKYLFNIIPEALSKFSEPDSMNYMSNQKTFVVFMENVLPLMQKDKHSESLIIKLCERLSNSLNILEIKNTAFCLSQINMNEKGLRKLIESFPDYKKTLETPDVLAAFKNLITKLKKSTKGDIKSLIEELDHKISNVNQDIFNADEVRRKNERNQKKQPKKKGQSGSASNSRKKGLGKDEQQNTNSRKKTVGRKPAKKYDSSDQQDDVMQIQESQSQEIQASQTQSRNQRGRPQRAAAARNKNMIVEQSQEEDEDDS